MGFETPQSNNQELDPVSIKADTYEFRLGDSVTVVRSDGAVENDWTLASVGGKFAVAEKTTEIGEHLKKAISLDEFKRTQILAKEGPAVMPFDRGIEIGIAENRAIAEKLGIDTTEEGWNERLQKKIRDTIGI